MKKVAATSRASGRSTPDRLIAVAGSQQVRPAPELRRNVRESFVEVTQSSPGGTVGVIAAPVGLARTCAVVTRRLIAGSQAIQHLARVRLHEGVGIGVELGAVDGAGV